MRPGLKILILHLLWVFPAIVFSIAVNPRYLEGTWVHLAKTDSIDKVVFIPSHQHVKVDIYQKAADNQSKFLVEEPISLEQDQSGREEAETTWQKKVNTNKYFTVQYFLKFYPLDLQHLSWQLTTEVRDLHKKSNEKYFASGEMQKVTDVLPDTTVISQKSIAVNSVKKDTSPACPKLKIECLSKNKVDKVIGYYKMDQHYVKVAHVQQCLPWLVKALSKQDLALIASFEKRECAIKFPRQCAQNQCVIAEISG